MKFNQSVKKKKGDLRANIMLEVTTNLMPAIFSTARLLQKPTRLTIAPIKKQRSHFMKIYWKIWILARVLQSCLKKSFSAILQKKKNRIHKQIHRKNFKKIENPVEAGLLVVEAFDRADVSADDGDLRGGIEGSFVREQRNG